MPDLIQKKFEEFHARNPRVLEELERLTYKELANSPNKQLGVKALFEKVRWESKIPIWTTHDSFSDNFQLNNNFHSRYVRLMIERHPNWANNFRLRKLVSQ